MKALEEQQKYGGTAQIGGQSPAEDMQGERCDAGRTG